MLLIESTILSSKSAFLISVTKFENCHRQVTNIIELSSFTVLAQFTVTRIGEVDTRDPRIENLVRADQEIPWIQ